MERLRIDIDKVVRSKSEKLYRRLPGFVLRWLKKTVHQDEINDVLEKCGDRKGVEFVDKALECMGITYSIHGLENIEKGKNYLFASNHPLGGLDGLVVISSFGKIFPDMKVVVNDILMNLTPIKDQFVPINKHGAMSREYASTLHEMYSSDCPVFNFPAGLCSRLIDGTIKDPEWKKTFVNQAKKYHRDIVPVYFEGRNSDFFYKLSKFRKALHIKFNIEMLYLPDEMFRQKGGHFDMYVGKPVRWEELSDGATSAEWTERIRKMCYGMKRK